FGWDLVLRWLLGDRYPDYHAYIDLKHGYNVRRASGIVAWVFVAAGIVLIPQMLRTHTAFYQDHMVVRRFLSLTDERIDYKQVVALNQVEQKKAPIGNWKNRPHHAITFADGTH